MGNRLFGPLDDRFKLPLGDLGDCEPQAARQAARSDNPCLSQDGACVESVDGRHQRKTGCADGFC